MYKFTWKESGNETLSNKVYHCFLIGDLCFANILFSIDSKKKWVYDAVVGNYFSITKKNSTKSLEEAKTWAEAELLKAVTDFKKKFDKEYKKIMGEI